MGECTAAVELVVVDVDEQPQQETKALQLLSSIFSQNANQIDQHLQSGSASSPGAQEFEENNGDLTFPIDETVNGVTDHTGGVPSTSTMVFEPEPFEFDMSTWAPRQLYMPRPYQVFRAIRESGTEGMTRRSIATFMGVRYKSIEKHWDKYMKSNKHLVKTYQKMSGRQKTHVFTWAGNSENNKNEMEHLLEKFAEVSDGKMITLGQSVAFPNTKLSNLQLTNHTVVRLTELLKIIDEHRVIVQPYNLKKLLTAREIEMGCKHEMDRRTIMKLILTLKKWDLLKIFTTTISEDDIVKEVQLICHRNLTADSPDLSSALLDARDRATSHDSRSLQKPFSLHSTSAKKKRKRPKKAQNEETVNEGFDLLDPSFILKSEPVPEGPITLEERLNFNRYVCTIAPCVPSDSQPIENDGGSKAKMQRLDETVNEVINRSVNDESAESIFTNQIETPLRKVSDRSTVADQRILLRNRDWESNNDVTEVTYDPNACILYGFQSKMVRLELIHEWLCYLLFDYQGQGPSFFDKFPPGTRFGIEHRPQPHVYVDDETWRRFLPPLPQYSDLQTGWFLLQDLLFCLPLSLYMLTVQIQFKIPGITEYLSDPVKRHTLIIDLPLNMRQILIKGRRYLYQLRRELISLGTLGLVTLGPNKCTTKIYNYAYDLFFVHRGRTLLDTSPSETCYTVVSPPLSQYNSYPYHFDSMEIVEQFWQHMRAICLSTPMGYRNSSTEADAVIRSTKIRPEKTRNELVQRIENVEDVQDILAVDLADGAAGFHPRLYLHRSLIWNFNPSSYAQWYINDLRRRTGRYERRVVERVKCIKSTWNSYVKGLIDGAASRRKLGAVRSMAKMPIKIAEKVSIWKGAVPKRFMGNQGGHRRKRTHRKLPRDSVDAECMKRKMTLRSKFTNRERDMLIFLRAVSHFLYPVYRIWVHPRVLRDIMHDHVPESRNKTAVSLNATVTRDLSKSRAKLTHLQNLVRKMETIPELVEIRNRQEITNSIPDDQKTAIYMEAFDVANRLMFTESVPAPSLATSEKELEQFLSTHRLFVPGQEVTEPSKTGTDLFWHAREPHNKLEILEASLFNAIISQFALSRQDGPFSQQTYHIYSQFPDALLLQVLHQLRLEGMLTRLRGKKDENGKELPPENQQSMSMSHEYAISFYYRHFFHHKFHKNMINQSLEMHKDLTRDGKISLMQDKPGHLVITCSLMCANEVDLNISVPERLIERRNCTNDNSNDNKSSTRELLGEMRSQCLASVEDQRVGRQAKAIQEMSDLRLSECTLSAKTKNPQSQQENTQLKQLAKEAENVLDTILPSNFGQINFEDFLLEIPVCDRNKMRMFYEIVTEKDILGASLDEIQAVLGDGNWKGIAQKLLSSYQIVKVGITSERYVTCEAARPWFINSFRSSDTPSTSTDQDSQPINLGPVTFGPRPWLRPDGTINRPMLKWMCEGVLMNVFSHPGMTETNLTDTLAHALQPRMTLELVDYLEKIGCLQRKESKLVVEKICGVFHTKKIIKTIVSLLTTSTAVQRYAQIFESTPMPVFLFSGDT